MTLCSLWVRSISRLVIEAIMYEVVLEETMGDIERELALSVLSSHEVGFSICCFGAFPRATVDFATDHGNMRRRSDIRILSLGCWETHTRTKARK